MSRWDWAAMVGGAIVVVIAGIAFIALAIVTLGSGALTREISDSPTRVWFTT